MKIVLLVSVLFLAACGGQSSTSEAGSESNQAIIQEPIETIEQSEPQEKQRVFLIAGQSNAQMCHWGFFQDLTGSRTKMIAIGGQSIGQLIDIYDNTEIVDGIIFVHGERDSFLETDPDEYIDQVEFYRSMIDAPMYLSTVGYNIRRPIKHNLILRAAVKAEAETNENWTIGFDDAHTFPARGMLNDMVHFTKQGCEEMQLNIAASLR
jgi:hypothetical protein